MVRLQRAFCKASYAMLRIPGCCWPSLDWATNRPPYGRGNVKPTVASTRGKAKVRARNRRVGKQRRDRRDHQALASTDTRKVSTIPNRLRAVMGDKQAVSHLWVAEAISELEVPSDAQQYTS